MNREKTSQVDLRRDEIGAIGRAFTALIKYFEEMTAVSQHITAGDLSIEVQPKSDQDMLGNALSRMVVNLRNLLSHVTENASSLGSASNQLAAASEQAGQAAEQITMTIQHVAQGAAQQSVSVSETTSSVDQMVRAIEGVAKGAQEQASAVTKSSEVTTQMATAIQQVAANAQAGARGASEAANTAQYGARIVDKNLESMETIKDRVSLASHKVEEMGKHSDQIGMIVETIDDIASQINLLALNAAIEAARVEGKGEQIVEQLLQRHLLGVLNLVAEMVAKNPDLNSVDLADLALQSQVESLSISDADGVIILSNDPESLGFRYSEDPEHESSASRPLLNQDDGVVIRPIEPRDSDGKPYLYVAISRRDCPGILSAGVPGEIAYLLGNFSRGFAVVADEVRKLAERTASATKQTGQLIEKVLGSVSEAVYAMDESAAEVDHGVIQAREAGKALHSILTAVEDVNRQVDEISMAAEQMTTSSNELVVAMESVSAIVEENTAATEEMSAGSNEVNQSIENIASVSEENSAAIEEISASTEEMSAQVEEVSASAASLADMSQQLTSLISQFDLGAQLNIDQEYKLSRQSSTAETISSPSAMVDIAANRPTAPSIGSNGR